MSNIVLNSNSIGSYCYFYSGIARGADEAVALSPQNI